MARFNANKFKREMRAAQRKINDINRKNERAVEQYNRKARAHNQKVAENFNQQVKNHNKEIRRVNAHNERVIGDLQKRLRTTDSGPRYTPSEQALADRVQASLISQDERDWDIFLSYARIDGSGVAEELRLMLEEFKIRVWFDEVAIIPGKSQSLQMDQGLRKARAGVALLTPAYLAGRFWTERELGVLLRKNTLIPVLDGVSFADVEEYSGILPDLAGFETKRDDLKSIAEKIAAAVLPEQAKIELDR